MKFCLFFKLLKNNYFLFYCTKKVRKEKNKTRKMCEKGDEKRMPPIVIDKQPVWNPYKSWEDNVHEFGASIAKQVVPLPQPPPQQSDHVVEEQEWQHKLNKKKEEMKAQAKDFEIQLQRMEEENKMKIQEFETEFNELNSQVARKDREARFAQQDVHNLRMELKQDEKRQKHWRRTEEQLKELQSKYDEALKLFEIRETNAITNYKRFLDDIRKDNTKITLERDEAWKKIEQCDMLLKQRDVLFQQEREKNVNLKQKILELQDENTHYQEVLKENQKLLEEMFEEQRSSH